MANKKRNYKIIETNNYTIGTNICKNAMLYSKFILVISEPGTGKTTLLYDFYQKNENVFYLKLVTSINYLEFYRDFLVELGDTSPGRLSINKMIKRICEILNYEIEGNKLIIIDEAGKSQSRMLEYLHEIRDATEATTGIILASPNYLKKKIDKWMEGDVDGVAEFYSRINSVIKLPNVKKKDIEMICKSSRLNDETINEIQGMKFKDLRMLHNLITDEDYNDKRQVI